MGSMKSSASFLAAFLLIAVAAATEICDIDTVSDKELCKQMTLGATTWEEAMPNALNSAKEMAESGKGIPDEVVKKLPLSESTVSKDSISKTCHESYTNIIYNIDSSKEFVKKDPHDSMRSFLSSISFNECTNSLMESGLTAEEAKHYADQMTNVAHVLLALGEKKPPPQQ